MTILQRIRWRAARRKDARIHNRGVLLFGTARLVKAKGMLWKARRDFSKGYLDGCPMKWRAKASAYHKTADALRNRISLTLISRHSKP